MDFVPTYAVFSSETDPLPIRAGFATLGEALLYADSKRRRYVIRRSRFIPGYPGRADGNNDGNFPRGQIVHTQT